MTLTKRILTYLFGAFMVLSGINHFLNPVMYRPMIPDIFPEALANYSSGVLEIIFGAMVFIPDTREWGGKGILLLMIIFLPIHLWDALKESPAIGNHTIALIRIPIQFVLIYWAWYISKK